MNKIDEQNNKVSLGCNVYDYISFRNLVKCEREELLKIKHEKAYDIYTQSRIRRLNHKGLLIVWIMGKCRRVRLSCLTRMILLGLIGDEDFGTLLKEEKENDKRIC